MPESGAPGGVGCRASGAASGSSSASWPSAAPHELIESLGQRREPLLGDVAASARLASACSSRTCGDQALHARLVGAPDLGGEASSAAIVTSRSRRSPSASASALTSRSAALKRLRGKARLEDLERGPQPAGRDPHVVDPLDVVGVEDARGVARPARRRGSRPPSRPRRRTDRPRRARGSHAPWPRPQPNARAGPAPTRRARSRRRRRRRC